MLNYYKANFPREPYKPSGEMPKVKCSVLMIHGLKDVALLPGGLNDTWRWVEKDFTLVTIPERVTSSSRMPRSSSPER